MTQTRILELIRQNPLFNQVLSFLQTTGQGRFAGMVGSAPAAFLAALTKEFSDIFIVVANTEKSLALKSELEFFLQRRISLFPAPDIVPGEDFEPAKELIGERLSVLEKMTGGRAGVIVAPVKAVMWRTSQRLESIRVSVNQNIRIEALIAKLVAFGYKRFDVVGEKGEFSVKGGIVDVFPLNLEQPLRLEFYGDELESIRLFDSYSQRSIGKLTDCAILPAREEFAGPIFNHLGKEALIVWLEELELSRTIESQLEEQAGWETELKYLDFAKIKKAAENNKQLELSAFIKPGEQTGLTSPPSYINKFGEIPQRAFVVSKHAARLEEELKQEVLEGSLRGGFIQDGLEVLTDRELFGEEVVFRKVRQIPKEGVADELLADLKPGDYVVHENYGIGIYRGTETLTMADLRQEYLLIEYAEGDKVYVPPSMAGMVEKYSSGSDYRPRLSRLGTKQWLRTKANVKQSLRNLTKELLELYAAREKIPGIAFKPDDLWQLELEKTFPYEETPDQQKAINEAKRDMESPRPMDRLVCGDVGYGKTEVAIRAAAKAVSSGRQVALLVPTTILADQHYNNFKERFKSSPFNVEMLSRFKTKKEQAGVVKALAHGGVDIVIGTHRLLSKDVKFKDLGLLVIDEEQRFGVAHKEKLKQLRKSVDVLTLSATPIPRTLYLSIAGARDMSVITTPPVDRSPIRTYVLPWSDAVTREAILRELDRGGQIYFVHNAVETIYGLASKIRKIVPEARITVAHGQMPEKGLEQTMIDFLERKFDVLVCTSIIESGLDITNVNTILIDQADRFGLSQLYQIRGRVGRAAVRAYAYLFYHPEKVMTDEAVERLKAIQEFTALGSGYKLAMRDLEIRGAGNLLGAEQSGHVMEVGFSLYCELLDEAVKEIKGVKESSPREVTIDLKIEAYIPADYVKDDRQRIALYRRMNHLSSKEGIEDLREELIDRFGVIPDKLNRLFELLYLKIKALKAGVKDIKEEANKIQIEWLSGKRKSMEIRGKDKIRLAEKGIVQ